MAWPVGSRTLEAMPVGGRMDGLVHLSHTCAPGSSGCSQHSTTWAGLGPPRGVAISVFFGERNDAEPNASCSNLTETIFSLSRHLPVLLTVSGPMIVLPPQLRASEPSSSLSPFPPLSISSLIFPDWTSVMLFPLHPFHFRFQ